MISCRNYRPPGMVLTIVLLLLFAWKASAQPDSVHARTKKNTLDALNISSDRLFYDKDHDRYCHYRKGTTQKVRFTGCSQYYSYELKYDPYRVFYYRRGRLVRTYMFFRDDPMTIERILSCRSRSWGSRTRDVELYRDGRKKSLKKCRYRKGSRIGRGVTISWSPGEHKRTRKRCHCGSIY